MNTGQVIAFVINVYDESPEMVSDLETSLMRFYPNAKIAVVPDGSPVQLKTPASAGRWISRYLDWGMASNPDWLVKIDPDTKVIRRLETPLSGDVQCAKKTFKVKDVERFYPHCGVIAYSRSAARAIHKEAINPRYVNFPGTRDDYQEEILIKAICDNLGLQITDRPDFQCGLRRNQSPISDAAFMHR